MKKAYLLLPILFLASCSSSNDDTSSPNNNGNNNGNNTPNTPVLIAKLNLDGETSVFSYNGSKISQVKNINTNEVSTYTYTGDLITEEIATGGSSTFKINYTYDGSGRLIKKVTIQHSLTSGDTSTDEANYTYTSNTAVKITYKRSSTMSSAVTTGTKNAILNSDGSLNSWTETASVPISGTTGFYAATGSLQPIVYDTKNSPYKNITGYLKIIDTEDENGSVHNVLNYNQKLNFNDVYGGAGWGIFKSTYDYNTSDYPTRNVRTYYDKTGNNITSSEVRTYEYNHL
ncbi:uncharacterized protein CHSO_0475 [Chryseobacterium sp. StRB126]|uniref:hypothetical protein n=1 Tax=Chryseobacterium sp. StRB126 TaxID=878220 RepID=UPI0004E98F75|nr:hypothetical protein [Chryseobacterium sp. StRB126]BAP29512.1 uncharacterized protein CHSO_0475 [Chryseobacterium sp. StRB126]